MAEEVLAPGLEEARNPTPQVLRDPAHVHLMGADERDEPEGACGVRRYVGGDDREVVRPLHLRPRPRPAHPCGGSGRGCGANRADRETTGKVRREGGGRQPEPKRSQGDAKWSQGESNGDPANAEDVEKQQQPSEVAAVVVEEPPSTKRPEKARKNPKRGANTGPGPVRES
jgi:hypothetical protein